MTLASTSSSDRAKNDPQNVSENSEGDTGKTDLSSRKTGIPIPKNKQQQSEKSPPYIRVYKSDLRGYNKTQFLNFFKLFIEEYFRDSHKVDAYIINEHNADVIWHLFLHIMYRNEELERMDRDPRKGILCTGPYGSGKSLIMEAIKYLAYWLNSGRGFRFQPMMALIDDYGDPNANDLEMVKYNKKPNQYGILQENPRHVCLDDIGMDMENFRHYGDFVKLAEELLLTRYELSKQGYITHMTTNLTFAEMKERYSPRLLSRFQEMFEPCRIEGPDYRKKK